MYVKESISFTILGDLEDENGSFEVLSIKLRPTCLPLASQALSLALFTIHQKQQILQCWTT